MIRSPVAWLLVMIAATLPACGDGTEEVPANTAAVQTDVAVPPVAATSAGEAATVLRVDALAGGGACLTDGSGRALYLLEGEPRGQSSCYDACASEWPPLLAAQGMPTAGAAPVQAGLLGTLQHRDGSTQVTYGGHALYDYQDDQGPGRTTGRHVTDQWGEWYLVHPRGEALEQHGGGGAGS